MWPFFSYWLFYIRVKLASCTRRILPPLINQEVAEILRIETVPVNLCKDFFIYVIGQDYIVGFITILIRSIGVVPSKDIIDRKA